MAVKRINIVVVRPFSTGNVLQEVGATVQMNEDQGKAMIACGKAKAGGKSDDINANKTGDENAK